MENAVTIIKYTFAIFGLLSLIGCIVLCITTTQFISDSIVTTGRVVFMEESRSSAGRGGIVTTYRPVVQFEAIDYGITQFASNVWTSPPSYHVGQMVEVIYNAQEPDNAKIYSFVPLWLAPIILGVLGTIFSSVGFGIILVQRRKRSIIRRLKEVGLPIETEFQRVAVNERVTYNGRHPYRIVSRWNKDNELHVFTSENLWFDPTDRIKSDKITVFVDPNNMKRYYMDVEFLK